MEAEPDSLLLFFFFQLTMLLSLPSIEVGFGLLLITLLLIGSALISGSEVAYFSLGNNDLEQLKQENGGSARRILALKEKPRRLLATILITNNFINIAIVIVSEFVVNQIFQGGTFLVWGNYLIDHQYLPNSWEATTIAKVFQFLFTVLGVTFVLVLFGEVAPKIYAKINNIHMAKLMSGPLSVLMRVFQLPSNILVGWTNAIEKRLEGKAGNGDATSIQDIGNAIDLTVSKEKNAEREVDILKRVIKFGEVSVKQIMRSRVDVVAVDLRLSFQDLLNVVQESGYSRIPVYEENFDNITGILYVKDLINHLQNDDQPFEWQALIRTDVLYVPEAKKIDDLLREFQRKHLHMAIVVDEYGGSSGIITLEDILEEIIGEITDEFDNELELIYRKIDDHNYVFEGKTLLNDMYRALDIEPGTFDDIRGDSDSIAGLVLELKGELPKINNEMEFNDFKFKVVSVSKRRIKEVQLTLPEYIAAK